MSRPVIPRSFRPVQSGVLALGRDYYIAGDQVSL
jgi:hypothetical protein